MGMIGYLREVGDDDLRRLDDAGRAHDLFRRGDPAVLSLEKSWHALHFLLTGSAEHAGDPLGFLMSGGREVAADFGYGRPRLLGPDAVRGLRDALAGISARSTVGGFYDADDSKPRGIYPGVWDEDPDELRDQYDSTSTNCGISSSVSPRRVGSCSSPSCDTD